MFFATGMLYNEMRKMLQWELPLSYFLTSLLKLAFVSMELFSSFFNTGNKFVLMEEVCLPEALQWILQEQWSIAFISVCLREGSGKAFTGFQGDPCRIT